MLPLWEIPKSCFTSSQLPLKALGVNEKICEADGSPDHIQQRHLVRWTDHFQTQIICLSLSAPPATIPANVQWPVITGPPTEAEMRGEI